MNKTNIDKIIESGSLNDRLKLMIEDKVRQELAEMTPEDKVSRYEPYLTYEQAKKLSDSFNTPEEKKAYNKWLHYDGYLQRSLLNLQINKLFIEKMYSSILGKIFLIYNIQKTEKITNRVLSSIDDQEKRAKIAKSLSYGSNIMFVKTNVSKSGNIRLSFRKSGDTYLAEDLQKEKKDIESSIILFKTMRKAILDIMKETDFDISFYKESIAKHSKILKTIKEARTGLDDLPDNTKRALSMTGLSNLCKEYLPDIEKLRIDQEAYLIFRGEK